MWTSKSHHLIGVRPNKCARATRPDLFDRIAQITHQPSAVACSGNALSRRIAKPANATSIPVPPKATRQPIGRVKVIIKPIHLFTQRNAPPVLVQVGLVENVIYAVKEAKLRPALRTAYGRYKSQIHLIIPLNWRAFLLFLEKVRGIAPLSDLSGGGWSRFCDVGHDEHVGLTSRRNLRCWLPAIRRFDQSRVSAGEAWQLDLLPFCIGGGVRR